MANRTLTGEGVEMLGDQEIAILIPARYGNRTLIKGDLREQASSEIRRDLSNLAGGASGRDDRLAKEQRLAGTFKDDAHRYIDEPVIRIYAKVGDDFLTSSEKKAGFVRMAQRLCGRLQQQAIGAEWGGVLYFVRGQEGGRLQPVYFRDLETDLQRDYLFVTLRRVRSVQDVAYLLFLDLWKLVTNGEKLAGLELEPICEKAGRRAWISQQPLSPADRQEIVKRLGAGRVSGGLGEKDLIFARAGTDEPYLQVWMCQGEQVRGGRRLYLVDDEGRIRRTSYELARSLLGARDADELSEVIDRERLTTCFFKEYRRLREAIAERLQPQHPTRATAEQEAQLLLGRLMFLRFLERKGMLGHRSDYLRQAFGSCQGNYYTNFLDPLFFEILDIPAARRTVASDLPFLNGGLFRPPDRRDLDLHDDLFDPAQRGSVLEVFYRFEFTLHEGAGAAEEVSVDPSMFGLVLESLTDPDQKKNKGIHYTPEEIARTLAREAIVRRLADRATIDAERLRRFALGKDDRALTEEEAERLVGTGKMDGVLFCLRILDPAVGSGSLLLASLQVLLELFRHCKARLGDAVVQGKRSWSLAARKFVRECLFGVDIDRDAVEVAKLRLWLALVIADDEVRSLPDLTYNIHVGDSLSEVGDPLAELLARQQRELGFDPYEKACNTFREALQRYRQSKEAETRTAAEELEAAERNLLIVRLEGAESQAARAQQEKLREGGALPFLWQVHYRDVFLAENKGFDVIIANPPYIRIQNLARETREDYKARFQSMQLRNRDIYLAFVEQALQLAGGDGRIAFIMPNFARTQAALPLRQLLAERDAVDLWVDFTDVQVFPTAANYVALLFARARRARNRTFSCRVIDSAFWKDPPEDWLLSAPQGTVAYKEKWGHLDCQKASPTPLPEAEEPEGAEDDEGDAQTENRAVTCPGVWRTNPDPVARRLLKMEKGCVPLGSLASVSIGVQTSKDEIFLLTEAEGSTQSVVAGWSDHLKEVVKVEAGAVVRCAKGSAHLKPFRLVETLVWCLWPYDNAGKPLSIEKLKEMPKAWAYLGKCEETLRQREKGKFDKDEWYSFRRPQGVRVARRPNKIIVPSTMNSATSYLDRQGDICFTASGTGGGGAWGIERCPNETRATVLWLLAVLNSDALWEWLTWEGDRKKGGWRGVDQGLLERVPVPVPDAGVERRAEKLVEQILASREDQDLAKASQALNVLVWNAYGLAPVAKPDSP